MPIVLRKTDLPNPLPPRYSYHKTRSLIRMPPPGTPQQELTYRAVRRRKHSALTYDQRLIAWQQSKENVLAKLDFECTPRVSGCKTFIYGRLSQSQRFLGHGEYKDSMGLDTQDDLAERWYSYSRERLGLPPLETDTQYHDKDVSRKTTFAQRPAAYRLLRALRRGDHVIFPAFDRLGCSAMDAASTLKYLATRGITSHIVGFPIQETFDPQNPLTMMLIAAFAMSAHFEWQSNSTRRKNATSTLKRSGKWTGNQCPYGFRELIVDGKKTFIADPDEQEFIREAYKAWCSGWAVYDIYLVAANIGVERLGKPWTLDALYAAINQSHDERIRHGGKDAG